MQTDALCRLGKPESATPLLVGLDTQVPVGEVSLRGELLLAEARCSSSKDEAKKLYQAAAALAHGKDEFVEAAGLLNLGFLLLGEGDFDAAISKFVDGLKVTSSPLLQDRMLGNLGVCYSQLGDFNRASYFSRKAAKIAADLHNDRAQEHWLIDLGLEHFHELEYSEAGRSYSDALRIAESLGDTNNESTCLHNLAQLALRTRDITGAEEYTQRLEQLKPGATHYLDLLLDRAEIAKAKNDLPTADSLLNTLISKMREQKGVEPATRWRAQSDLASVYSAEQKFTLADHTFREAVATADAARSKIQGIEYRISFLDQAPFYDQYVKFLVLRNRASDALDVAELGRSPTLSEAREGGKHNSLSLKRLQQELKTRRAVALAYWLGWEESYLWAITPSQVKLFRLKAEPEIEKAAESYTQEILNREDEQADGDSKLYDLLVRPAAELIPQNATVIIVPHRRLYNLNFETIRVPGPKPHYWIEDVRLENVSFLGALLHHNPPPGGQSRRKLLLMGAPVQVNERYPVLKYADAEMTKVATHFRAGETTVVRGSTATPQDYLSSNPAQYDLVHFVTHGTSSTVLESPLDAAIILSPTPGSNPSVDDPEGSYHLYGKDIMKTPLHADLVTVSACYGLGREYSGEGLVGLAWAFLRAGAHQVIAALWEVDDASSPQLMDDFYGELTQGKPAAEALRDAKLKMLRSSDFHRHPYYWASLQLYTGS